MSGLLPDATLVIQLNVACLPFHLSEPIQTNSGKWNENVLCTDITSDFLPNLIIGENGTKLPPKGCGYLSRVNYGLPFLLCA